MDANTIPLDLARVSKTIQESLAKAREMTRAMFEVASGSSKGFNSEILERMRELDVALQVGFPADAQAIAEFLTHSNSPMQELFERQSKGLSSVPVRSQRLSVLIVQAALAEQQNADHSLRNGRTRFDARLLESTLEDWVMRGAHRPGAEASPLAAMAKAIDLGAPNSIEAMESRFGCVIPVVVSICTWACWQAQSRPEPLEGQTDSSEPEVFHGAGLDDSASDA